MARGMDDDQISRNLAHAKAVADRYGYETVPAREMYETFDHLADLDKRGFQRIKSGFYGKQLDASIAHVVKLMPWKGGIYTLGAGVSLSFVPHAWDPKLRWHEGLKAARLDLFETNFRSVTDKREDRDLTDIGAISVTHGGRYMYLTCLQTISRSTPEMWRWFKRVGSLKGILATALAQDKRPDCGTHHPNPKIIYTFTLARLGRHDAARAAFESYPVEWETQVGRATLERALDDVILERRR